MGRRRQARECALQALYLCDTSSMSPEEAMLSVKAGTDLDARSAQFAEALALGTASEQKTLDAAIEDLAQNWSLKRMAAVDRNLLRMAAYEILQGETPRSVVIDEALEIAKSFSSADSSRFINGILDKIVDRSKPEKAQKAVRKNKKQ